ncbi:uncharacterized protein LOC134468662 [Engraulis encrasicolus]|uniref:uncharacterized protein LOC134468662 n=1 Tax=Engraulis encrasicolus TaxID=184585 RepID=UPI002FD52149
MPRNMPRRTSARRRPVQDTASRHRDDHDDDINLAPMQQAGETGRGNGEVHRPTTAVSSEQKKCHSPLSETTAQHLPYLKPPYSSPEEETESSESSALAPSGGHMCYMHRLQPFSLPFSFTSDSSSSSRSSSGRSSCGSPTQRFLYWLEFVFWSATGRAADFGRYLYSLRPEHLPLDKILMRGEYEHLRRKALPVAGLMFLTLLVCCLWVPSGSHQPPSEAVDSGTSGASLPKIQEQLMEILKQLADKEAGWSGNLQNEETETSGSKVELSRWLQEYLFAGSSSREEGVVAWPDLRGALEGVEKRLVQNVQNTLQAALLRYRSDGTGMHDYALELSGGKVIKSHYIKPYCPNGLENRAEGPEAVIQPEVHPGKCWSFRGSYASVTIALSQSINITHVSIEHIPKGLSPTGRIDSAPQDFAVYGLSHVDQRIDGVSLGKFTYNADGDPIQTFEVKEPGRDFYPAVELRIMTNWGDPMYTCVYRFRVHGLPRGA